MFSPVNELSEILTDRKLTMAVAESCTGGLIGSELTHAPGASAFYLGSAVTYSNDSKEKILGVSKTDLDTYGAVSETVAVQMADGVRSLYGSDLSVAVTGIAGPDGGTEDKPVGTVYIAVSDGSKTDVRKFSFGGDRDSIRRSTVDAAVGFLLDLLETEQ